MRYSRLLRPGMAPAMPIAPADSAAPMRRFHAAEAAINSWCDEAHTRSDET